MFVKLSASGNNMYQACQRKYWHKRLNKTVEDHDWKKSKALSFGSAMAECQEIFAPNVTSLMTSKSIIEIFQRHNLDVNDAAKGAACLRKYYSSFLNFSTEKVEIWLEHDIFVGKIDKIGTRDGRTYIVEDKCLSEINPALKSLLQMDPQLCLYADCREQFNADAILYRVVTKPKERRKKEESWSEYTQRCKCDAIEITIEFEDLKIAEVKQRLLATQHEISEKGMDKDKYLCNEKNCIVFGSACEYYSQCHEKNYSDTIGEW